MNKLATHYDFPDPGLTIFDGEGNSEVIDLPSALAGRNDYADFMTWHSGSVCRTYILGAFSGNVCWTEHEALVRMFIRPPSAPVIVTATPALNEVGIQAAAGPGLTGSCRFALRWRDTQHARRSPLGGASAAVVLANQGLAVSSAPGTPIPDDPYVDLLEVWVSVDGGLFRHWGDCEIGVPSFTINETATGEAYTTTLIELPLVAIGAIAHGRLFAAADPINPQRIHISEANLPEDYSGVSIDTTLGEPVIGLKNVGGIIYVQCPDSSYYIQGFGPSDFVIRSLKTNIGGFGQATIMMVDDIAVISTRRGKFRYDGGSFIPLGVGEWDETWRLTVSDPDRRAPYEEGFGAVDYVSGVLKFKARPAIGASEIETPKIIGFPTDQVNHYWVISMKGLIPSTGGDGQANLTFDQHNGSAQTAAATLYEPDQSVGQFYIGDVDGNILLENQLQNVDRKTVATVETVVPKRFLVHTMHEILSTVAEAGDASQTTDAWVIAQNENVAAVLGIYGGNEFAWQAGTAGSASFSAPEQFTIPAGRSVPATAPGNAYVPRDRYLRKSLAKSPGSCVSVRLTATQNADIGSESSLHTIHQRAEVVFTGWGIVAQPGTERQPLAPYIP